MSFRRAERATAVLLADPCFQLRSIQYLLGHAEPLALAAAPPATDKRHFSLHTCKCWHRAGSWAVLTPYQTPAMAGMGLLVSAAPAMHPSPFSPGDGGPCLPCCPPVVALGMGLCPVLLLAAV